MTQRLPDRDRRLERLISQLEKRVAKLESRLTATKVARYRLRVSAPAKPRTNGLTERVVSALGKRDGTEVSVAEIIKLAGAEGHEQSVRTVLRRLAAADAGITAPRRGFYRIDRSKVGAKAAEAEPAEPDPEEEVGF